MLFRSVKAREILSVQQEHDLPVGSDGGLDVTIGHAQILVFDLQLEKLQAVSGVKCLSRLRKRRRFPNCREQEKCEHCGVESMEIDHKRSPQSKVRSTLKAPSFYSILDGVSKVHAINQLSFLTVLPERAAWPASKDSTSFR